MKTSPSPRPLAMPAQLSEAAGAATQSDQRRYFVRCPHCEAEQHLVWAQVKWPEGRPDDAAYFCEACGADWTDAERRAAIRWGVWRPTHPE